jgi:glutaredoxin-like protein NrdH
MDKDKRIVLFALSTCPACRKTRELLAKYNVDYLLVELDTVDRDSREKLLQKLREYNPKETFPTLVIDGGKKVVIGYGEEEILETIGFKNID